MELNPAPQGRKKQMQLLLHARGPSAICMTHHARVCKIVPYFASIVLHELLNDERI